MLFQRQATTYSPLCVCVYIHRMPSQLRALDFNDTFLSLDHLKASFPQYEVQCTTEDPEKQVPPFKLTFPEEGSPQKRKHPDNDDGEADKRTVIVEPYTIPNRGPYPYNQPKRLHFPWFHVDI